MGHLAKPAFAIAFGEFSNRCRVLTLPTAMSPKELLIEKTHGQPILYDLALYSSTNVPKTTDELFMKSCKS